MDTKIAEAPIIVNPTGKNVIVSSSPKNMIRMAQKRFGFCSNALIDVILLIAKVCPPLINRELVTFTSSYEKLTDEQKAARVQKMLETKRLKASIKN